jgi:uncharacterized RDD family membrane protein YckC
MAEEERPPERGDEPLLARLVGAGTRTGLRGAGRVAEATGVDRALEDAASAAVIRALESPAAERALVKALESAAVERSLTTVIDSAMIERVWERLLASDEAQKLVERIAGAPEIRQAIAYQGVGLVDDVGAQIGRVARRLDDTIERVFRTLFRRPRREGAAQNAGVLTRGLAFLLDGVILNFSFFAISSLIVLALNAILDVGDASAPALVAGSFVWALAGSAYLVTFWSLSGETPGMRFFDLRLDGPDGRRLGVRRATRRLIGTILSVLPFFLGFLGILFDERRRAWNDRFSQTEVRYLPPRREAPWATRDEDAD